MSIFRAVRAAPGRSAGGAAARRHARAGLLLWLGSAVAAAQGFPVRPVTLVIPVAAGGPVDVEMHLYAPRLRDALGQPVVMEYKLGAGGTVAGAYAAKAAPDGHTLLVINGSFTTFSSLYKDLSFDTLRDFAPVTLTSRRDQLLLVTPGFAAQSFADYLAWARANPGRINIGTAGAGSRVC